LSTSGMNTCGMKPTQGMVVGLLEATVRLITCCEAAPRGTGSAAAPTVAEAARRRKVERFIVFTLVSCCVESAVVHATWVAENGSDGVLQVQSTCAPDWRTSTAH